MLADGGADRRVWPSQERANLLVKLVNVTRQRSRRARVRGEMLIMDEEHIFFTAIERHQSAAECADLLDEACANDDATRRRLTRLLATHFSVTAKAAAAHASLMPDAASGTQTWIQSILSPSSHASSLGRLAHYEILQPIGLGGSSLVFEALDVNLQRIVAIKVLAPERCRNSAAREQFQAEATALALIAHPNVVQVLGGGEQDGVPFFAIELASGCSVKQRVEKQGPIPPADVILLARQLAAGIQAVHAAGWLHQDLKPSNILLDNAETSAKIADFGIAREDDKSPLRGASATSLGTPEFMAPEQALGQPQDARSDLFSLGAVLYFMLTGVSPFAATAAVVAMRRVCEDTPVPAGELIAAVPAWLEHTLARLLEKEPANRFASATELLTHLDACYKSELAGRPLPRLTTPSRKRRLKKRLAPRRLLVTAFAAMACGLLAIALSPALRGQLFGNSRHTVASSAASESPDLQAARWLLQRNQVIEGYWWNGARVVESIDEASQLPDGDFQLQAVALQEINPADYVTACKLFQRCSRLSALRIAESPLDGESLRLLAEIPALQHLELSHVGDADTEHFLELARLPHLRELSLNYSADAGAFVDAVCAMPRIRAVSLWDCPVTDGLLNKLANHPGLERLAVHSRFPTDAAVAALTRATSLRELDLCSAELTDAVWANLARMPKLQTVSLGSFPTHLSSKLRCAGVSELEQVTTLTLGQVNLDAKLVSHLLETEQLQSLTFTDSKVTKSEAPRLMELPRLEELQFVNTVVADDDIRAAEALRPECQVSVRYLANRQSKGYR